MTTPQLNLTKNAEIVLKTRYLLGDETPEDLLWRSRAPVDLFPWEL